MAVRQWRGLLLGVAPEALNEATTGLLISIFFDVGRARHVIAPPSTQLDAGIPVAAVRQAGTVTLTCGNRPWGKPARGTAPV